MPTTTHGVPYLDGTEDVKDYPTTSEELADRLEALGGFAVVALPAAPSDGDEATLVDSLAAPTYAWRLKYLAAAAKWIYLGGVPAVHQIATDETRTSNSVWGDLATIGPTITVPRAGTYDVEYGAKVGPSGSADSLEIGVALGAANPAVDTGAKTKLTAGADVMCLAGFHRFSGLAAAQELRLRYNNGNALAHWQARILVVRPAFLT